MIPLLTELAEYSSTQMQHKEKKTNKLVCSKKEKKTTNSVFIYRNPPLKEPLYVFNRYIIKKREKLEVSKSVTIFLYDIWNT